MDRSSSELAEETTYYNNNNQQSFSHVPTLSLNFSFNLDDGEKGTRLPTSTFLDYYTHSDVLNRESERATGTGIVVVFR